MEKIPIDLGEHVILPSTQTKEKIKKLIMLANTYSPSIVSATVDEENEEARRIAIEEVKEEYRELIRKFIENNFLFPEETAVVEAVMLLGREFMELTTTEQPITEERPVFLLWLYKRFYKFALEGARNYGPGEIKYIISKLPELANYLTFGLRAVKTLEDLEGIMQIRAWQQTMAGVEKKIKGE